MSMMRALALLGSGAEGFVQGQRDEEKAGRDRNAEAFAQKQRAFQAAQMDRATQEQAALEGAAAPVQPIAAPPMDVGGVTADEEGNALPPQGPMSTVAGQRMPAGQAPAAAAEANSPEAIQARQLAVYQRTDPAKAASMQASMTQQKAAKIKAANDEFDNGLNTAAGKGWDSLTQFMSSSGAHPAQSKFVPNPDGKTGEVHIVQPDGSLKPTGMVFPNTAEGALEAASMLARSTPIQSKVAHVLAAGQLRRQEARDTADSAARERHDKIMERYYQGLIDTKFDANDVRAGLAAGKFAKMPEEDKATLKALDDQLKEINSERVKAQAGGMWQADSPGEKAMKVKEATLLMQRQTLIAPYLEKRGVGAPDPQNLRGGGGGGETTTTTRPMTPEEIVAKDIKAGGEKGIPGQPVDATSTLSQPDGSIVTRQFGKGATPAGAAKPGPMQTAVSGKPFEPDPAMEAKLRTETAEMNGSANRMSFSPQVAAYVAAKKAAKDAEDKARDMAGVEERRKTEFARANRGLR